MKYILIAIFIFTLFLIYKYKPEFIENFSTYQQCIGKGFTKEFCLKTPTLVLGPNACSCPNGSVGKILPGFGGNCVCKQNYNTIPANIYGLGSHINYKNHSLDVAKPLDLSKMFVQY